MQDRPQHVLYPIRQTYGSQEWGSVDGGKEAVIDRFQG
jgi:hypothetical protein